MFIVSWFWCSLIDYHAVSMAQGCTRHYSPEMSRNWNRHMARSRTIFSCSSLDRIAISRRIRLTTETCDGMEGEHFSESIEKFMSKFSSNESHQLAQCLQQAKQANQIFKSSVYEKQAYNRSSPQTCGQSWQRQYNATESHTSLHICCNLEQLLILMCSTHRVLKIT